jgi:hypothetical protein
MGRCSVVEVDIRNNIGDHVEGHAAEPIVDVDIDGFEKWFCQNVDTSTHKLAHSERAILKSYLWYKTSSEVKRGEDPTG